MIGFEAINMKMLKTSVLSLRFLRMTKTVSVKEFPSTDGSDYILSVAVSGAPPRIPLTPLS